MLIKEIEEKKIVLDKNGETITLRSADIEFLKTGGSSSRRQDRSVHNENTAGNNNKSSEATKRTNYSNMSKKNSVKYDKSEESKSSHKIRWKG